MAIIKFRNLNVKNPIKTRKYRTSQSPKRYVKNPKVSSMQPKYHIASHLKRVTWREIGFLIGVLERRKKENKI